MACSSVVRSYLRPDPHDYRNRGLALSHEYLSSNSICSLRSKFIFPKLRSRRIRTRSYGVAPVGVAFKNNIFRVLQTALKVGEDGVEAGTNLVPVRGCGFWEWYDSPLCPIAKELIPMLRSDKA